MLAETYAGQQKTDLALAELARAANSLPANSPQKEEAVLRFLQSLVTDQLRKDERKRNWQPIVEQLDKFTANKTPRPEYEVLRADILLGQGKPDEARKALEACTKKKPKSPSVWLALVRLAMYQAGNEADVSKKAAWWKAAANYIDQAEKVIGDGVILRMVRGTLALASKDPRLASDPRVSEKLKSLGEKTDAMNDAEKLQLWAILGNMSEQAGDIDLSQDFFRRQARQDTKNVHVRYRLCELQLRAFEKGHPADAQELDRLVDEIEKLSGQGPYWLYAKAIRAFVQANNKDPKLLLEARGYVQDAMKARSDWACAERAGRQDLRVAERTRPGPGALCPAPSTRRASATTTSSASPRGSSCGGGGSTRPKRCSTTWRAGRARCWRRCTRSTFSSRSSAATLPRLKRRSKNRSPPTAKTTRTSSGKEKCIPSSSIA